MTKSRLRCRGVPEFLCFLGVVGWIATREVAASQRYQELVGDPPPPTELAFKDWLDRLVTRRLQSLPLERQVTYFFSQDGDDQTGDGSLEAPWRTLDQAQAMLNQHARSSLSAGLCLKFRAGDTWRTPAILRARIHSINGTLVQLD